MKVRVLKSGTGKVIATFEQADKKSLTLEPSVSRGQTVEDSELPNDYVNNLHVVYKKRAAGKKTGRG